MRMRVVVTVIVSMAAALVFAVRMRMSMAVVMLMAVVVIVTVVMAVIVPMLVRVISELPGNGMIVAAATAATGGFRFGGVVVDRQSGGEIEFHASIQNPEEAPGSSPRLR